MLPEEKSLPAEYAGMLQEIKSGLPLIAAASQNFYKSSSQFKAVVLDNTALTPIRTIKQILAECERTKQALQEAYFRMEKNKVEIERNTEKLCNGGDRFDKRLLEIQIAELRCNNETTENYMKGAIRKLAFQMAQYKQMLSAMGKDELTEADYEREEAEYHVMTAFKQALCAARAHGGRIDEGNHIYLFDLGINGEQAQREISAYLDMERKHPVSHEETLVWLKACAEKFKINPKSFAQMRGLEILEVRALRA